MSTSPETQSVLDAMNSTTIRVGNKYPTWFSGNSDGLSTILDVYPYKGRYKDWFTHILKLSAPSTARGWMEMSVFIPR